MKIYKKLVIEFDKEELEALKMLKDKQCSGVPCEDCPFKLKNEGCMIIHCQEILRRTNEKGVFIGNDN